MDARGAVFFEPQGGKPIFLGKLGKDVRLHMTPEVEPAATAHPAIGGVVNVECTVTFDEHSRRVLRAIANRLGLNRNEFLRFQSRRKGKPGWRHTRPPLPSRNHRRN